MNKFIFFTVSGIIILLAGIYLSKTQNTNIAPDSDPNPKDQFNAGDEVRVSGFVTQNVYDRVAVDGQAYFDLLTQENYTVRVIYHPGEAECPNNPA